MNGVSLICIFLWWFESPPPPGLYVRLDSFPIGSSGQWDWLGYCPFGLIQKNEKIKTLKYWRVHISIAK